MFRLLSLIILITIGYTVHLNAQEMPINGPDISQCGGFLVDDGFSSSNYSNNQNQTITICAPQPETIINLYFAVCALGAGDNLKIYDGNSTAAPLIGTYTGADLQTTDITSTNPTGCLTVQFTSDGSVTGNFGAEISCGPPCVRPVSVINTNQNPIPVLLCPGESITFDGSATQFAPGASLQSFEWQFDDGTTSSTGWPTVSHTFEEPGAYEVQLKITDNNDCSNNNLNDYVILVSTYPDFSLLSPNFELCQGGLEYIGVNYFIPDSIYGNDSLSSWIDVPYDPTPDVDFGGALFIPDDQSECFSSELTFSGFQSGATITQTSDLEFFYINFEHSFMGDITVTFICPNGQSIAVHQQGGGGTLLGEPVDDDFDLSPGIGYDYYWAPDATNGTWEEESGGTLPAGTYQSVQPWNSIVGCPLNGTWTVEICDLWSSDNGFIFDWSMAFNPSYYGDLYPFTPIYGADCDSSYWTGPFIVSQDPNCDFIGVEINTTGSYDYTYTVTNNFGCTFDTTITVNVFVAAQVTAGPDMIFSCDPIQFQGGIDPTLSPDCDNVVGAYEQCFSNNQNWVQTYCPDAIGDGVTNISIDVLGGAIDDLGDQMYVYNGSSTGSPILEGPISGDLSSYFFTANNPEGCLTLSVQMNGSVSCQTGQLEPFVYEVICGESNIPYVWQWTPSEGLNNPSSATPTLSAITNETDFILTGYPQGYPGCGSSDTMTVVLDPTLPSPGDDAAVSMCPGVESFSMLSTLGGIPTPGGIWYNSAGAEVPDTFDPSTDSMGLYEYVVIQDGCVLSAFLDITISQPSINVSPDTTVCIGGTASLEAWTDPFNEGIVDYFWSNGASEAEQSVEPAESQIISVYVSDGATCTSDTAYVEINLYSPLNIIAENDSVICPNSVALAETSVFSGGLPPYSFSWTMNNAAIGNGQSVSQLMGTEAAEFCVTIYDACETPPASDCMLVDVPVPIDITINPVTQGDCSPFEATIEITSDESSYSSSAWQFSDGQTAVDTNPISLTFTEPGTYDATLALQNEYGCIYTETFEDVITVYPDPIAAWNADPMTTDVENTTIQFNNLSQGAGLTYLWDFGTPSIFDTSTELSPVFSYSTQAGNEYTVTLGVTDSNGCYDEIIGVIDVNDLFNIWIPNSFTPNNDRVNDVVFVSGSDISSKDFEWIIFNRWGDVVFYTTDPTIPWTGNVSGGEHYAADGVYNYILKARAETHVDEIIKKGIITLIR